MEWRLRGESEIYIERCILGYEFEFITSHHVQDTTLRGRIRLFLEFDSS